MRQAIPIVVVLALWFAGCDHSNPTAPNQVVLPDREVRLSLGYWMSEEGACITVEPAQVTLIAGCWRGSFPTPVVGAGGTFSVDGTFRFEAGPSPDTPAPPAHFSGAMSGSTLHLTIQRTGSSEPPLTYSFTFRGEGSCPSMCV